MNLLSLAHFTSFFICLSLIFYVLSKNLKSKANIICAFLIGCFTIWNFAYSFLAISQTSKQAMFWMSIASIGWCSFPVFSVWLTLVLMKNEKMFSNKLLYPVVFLVQLFFIYSQFKGSLVAGFIRMPYGWGSVWSTSIWPLLFFGYNFMISMFYIFVSFTALKDKKIKFKKGLTLLINASIAIFIIIGLSTESILPYFKIYTFPQLGALSSLFMCGGIAYSISRYKVMVLTPAYAAADILSTMSDCLVLISPAGKIIEINNAVIDLTGYSRKELIEKEANILFKEPVFMFDAAHTGILTGENGLKGLQAYFITKTGIEIPMSFSGSAMKDKDGALIGFVTVSRDIRELKRLQQKEIEFTVEKTRFKALQERADELEDAYNQLKTAQAKLIQSEKMAAIGQLAGGVSHEINNPMGVILGFAQSIVKRLKEDDPLYMPLKSIEREAVRCKKLISDLLAFSRTGKTYKEITDINETIDEILSLASVQAKIQNVTITRDYTIPMPQITANKNQLQQVILNLSNNAIDAMPSGGLIKIRTCVTENQVEIIFSDTGKGMTEDEKKHIFEPFFTTKEPGKGTGLGLSLCYTTIKQHDGTIEVESQTGKGTTFRIKLPINNKEIE